jgi:hypothetical protein
VRGRWSTRSRRREPEATQRLAPLVPGETSPRTWNIWELERLAGEGNGGDDEERALLLVHMRPFANASGELPVEFDGLVRQAFGSKLARPPARTA